MLIKKVTINCSYEKRNLKCYIKPKMCKLLHAIEYNIDNISEGTDIINTDKLREFLRKGHLNISHTRGIIVGCAGAGKTTLLMRLQDMPWKDTTSINTTKIADVHVNSFEVLKKKMTIRGKMLKLSNISSTGK